MPKVLVPFDRSGEFVQLPPVCMSCGKPATRTVRLDYLGRARTFLGMRFVSEDQDGVTLDTPLCSGHPLMGMSGHVMIVGIVMLVIMTGLWALFKWLNPQLPQSAFNAMVVTTIPLWVGGFSWMALSGLRGDGYDKKGLVVKGVHADFIDALDEYEGSEADFKAELKQNRKRSPYKKPPFWVSPFFFTPVLWVLVALIAAPLGYLSAPKPGGPGLQANGPEMKQLVANAPAVTGDQRIDGALAILASPNQQAWHGAADTLAKTPVDKKHQVVVAQKLAQCMDTPNAMGRQTIIAALGVWGTANEVPAILKAFADPNDRFLVAAGLAVVGHFKDPRLVAPVVSFLGSFGEAEPAVRDLGPIAEGEVAKLLQHQDPAMRQRAARLLKDVGTAKSIPDLQAALSKDPSLRDDVGATLRQLAFAGKQATFEGTWEGTNQPKDIWTITNDGKGWKVQIKYYQDKTEVGACHGDNCRLDNGVLAFKQVFDKKPSPLWSDNAQYSLKLEGPAELSFEWQVGGSRGNGRLLRKLP